METENRRNLVFTGNYKTIINDIIKFYEDEENEDTYELYRNNIKIMDNERLYRLFKNIDESFVQKQHYETVKNSNQELREKIKNLEKEIQNYREKFKDLDFEVRKEQIICELSKENFDYSQRYTNVALEKSNLVQQLKEQEKITDKWKAMFTEQALANAKLINLLNNQGENK